MPKMKHHSPTKADRTAMAPYNFVRLPEKVLQPPDSEDQLLDLSSYKGINGIFEINIKASSAIYIRGMLSPKRYAEIGKKKNLTNAEKNEIAPFFNQNGQIRLPASSIRGMFRNLIEIITYSKPAMVSDKHYMYRSVDTTRHAKIYQSRLFDEDPTNEKVFYPKYLAGYMHKDKQTDQWYIKPAQEIDGVTFARVSHDCLDKNIPNWHQTKVKGNREIGLVKHQKVFVKTSKAKLQDVCGGFIKVFFMKTPEIRETIDEENQVTQEATLIVSGGMESKKSEAVVFPVNQELKRDEWLKVSHELEMNYLENSIPEFSGEKIAGKRGVLEDEHPVFYLVEDNQLVAFGHCPMFRIPYKNSPYSLIPEELKSTPFDDFAERMFGYVKKDANGKTTARAGRLFFTDALWIRGPEKIFEFDGQPIPPKILSEPKPTTFQHYLAQSKPDDKSELLDYDDKTSTRGTKMYWLKGEKPDYLASEEKVQRYPSQFTRISPLKKGNCFRCKLKIENLSEIELGALGWIIRIGSDPKYRLRLGMAKPYGLGAIIFENVSFSQIDRERRYARLFSEGNEDFFSWDQGFEDPEKSKKLLDSSIEKFEQFLLADNEINPNHKKSINGLERILELLRILSWPGPKPTVTEYISKLRDFSDRRVLPNACDIEIQRVERESVVATVIGSIDDMIICEIDGDEDVIGEIDPHQWNNFTNYAEGDVYKCYVIGEPIETNDEIVIALQPYQKG